ncbi:hypothetical protein CF165_22955 [Amycolatopsis vastitatis]|uniref:DUF2637 domain-containing protein n=1 Tax=Amycolatopsis vastitatis TaxID=1905142 RepID=A0A229T2I3_9PSEU|nr:hypothetical protein CF165_22955 [Amycolatopsis vastitatis]
MGSSSSVSRFVTTMMSIVIGLTFLFGFGNVLALALRIGVPAYVAPLVAPALDLTVLGLLVAGDARRSGRGAAAGSAAHPRCQHRDACSECCRPYLCRPMGVRLDAERSARRARCSTTRIGDLIAFATAAGTDQGRRTLLGEDELVALASARDGERGERHPPVRLAVLALARRPPGAGPAADRDGTRPGRRKLSVTGTRRRPEGPKELVAGAPLGKKKLQQ